MVSSTAGLHGSVGQANYSAAKAAVVGLAKTIAKEWGPFGVRANTVAFGLVHTRCVSVVTYMFIYLSNSTYIHCVPWRLTAAKEAGASIEIDGKTVALGIPRPSGPPDPSSLSATIPLGRGGSPDEAAAAMLLCVLSTYFHARLMCFTTDQPFITSFFFHHWPYPRSHWWKRYIS
jgi:3-oxoacyl-[acyl-carrier protein] reductase